MAKIKRGKINTSTLGQAHTIKKFRRARNSRRAQCMYACHCAVIPRKWYHCAPADKMALGEPENGTEPAVVTASVLLHGGDSHRRCRQWSSCNFGGQQFHAFSFYRNFFRSQFLTTTTGKNYQLNFQVKKFFESYVVAEKPATLLCTRSSLNLFLRLKTLTFDKNRLNLVYDKKSVS